MKVITIKQPFATLIAEGYKKYEFRTWKTKYRGEVLIHAGKSIDKEAMKKFAHLNLEYPRGVIIAKAKITDCIYIGDEMRRKLSKEDSLVYSGVIKDLDWVGYGFKLEDVKKVSQVEALGNLGLWNYDFDDDKSC